MTDATTGPGSEGAPRDGKQRGTAAVPASVPGHDPATGEPAAAPRGEGADTGAVGRETGTIGREPGAVGRETGTIGRETGAVGRETATGRDTVPGGETLRGRDGGIAGEVPGDRDTAVGRESGTAGEGPGGRGTAGGPDVGTADDRGAAGGTAAGHTAVPGVTGGTGATGRRETAAGPAASRSGATGSLLPHDESDKLSERLHHAVTGFVDGPRSAVEEADHVLEEVAARFTEAVAQRRRTLRHSWQAADDGGDQPATSTDTEQLRLALRDYRELTERLLRL